ncbi:MAG TPA: acyl-CoA carboxylase subunit beta [Ktedonobacteraceae bacterium]|jgi:acetyl-CoA carboxylase carboxyltransferase component|nr:acyl-CoA carboxylase subunit beta [Ktedonobacteraceae bacterium]
MTSNDERLAAEIERIQKGGAEKYHARNREQKKLFARDRLKLLLDDGKIEFEDGMFAECLNPELPADAVITGVGRIHGRPVAFSASDSTVKAGTAGEKSVQKNLRIQELAMQMRIPMFYLIDSAGARITDQIRLFPGRNQGGRTFYNQIKMSGVVPQIAIMFGPSPAGAAYTPAFADIAIMVEGNASAYLGSPRMAEMVTREKVTLEEMGGARMHCTVSGLGDFLAQSEEEALHIAKEYFRYMPQNYLGKPADAEPVEPASNRPLKDIVPEAQSRPFNMYDFLNSLIDGGSFLEYKKLFAPELITGFARLGGRVVGIVANQPRVKGGVLFVDSSDKGTRFVNICNAFNIPLLFLADVSGFMIGSAVERAGIIRHGAKFIAAVSQAIVPKICVVVRKCYGAGLYAMAGPAFGTDAVIALPTAQIAVMGPEAAINAVYANQMAAMPEEERETFRKTMEARYAEDIDIFRLASELIVDTITPFESLRGELIARFSAYQTKEVRFSECRNPIYPV